MRNKRQKNSVSLCLCVQKNKHLNDYDRRINYTEDFVLVHGDTETQRKNLALCEIKNKLRVSVSLCTK